AGSPGPGLCRPCSLGRRWRYAWNMAFFVSGIMGLFLHAIFTLVKCLFYAGFLVGILLTLFPWLVGSILPGRRPKKPWRRTRVKSTRISVRSLSYPIRARLGANVFRVSSLLE